MKFNVDDYIDEIVEHKNFGPCKVLSILDHSSRSVKCELVDSGEVKKLVLSSKFFDVIDEQNDPNAISVKYKNFIKSKREAAKAVTDEVDEDFADDEYIDEDDMYEDDFRDDGDETTEEMDEANNHNDLLTSEFDQDAYYDGDSLDE